MRGVSAAALAWVVHLLACVSGKVVTLVVARARLNKVINVVTMQVVTERRRGPALGQRYRPSLSPVMGHLGAGCLCFFFISQLWQHPDMGASAYCVGELSRI